MRGGWGNGRAEDLGMRSRDDLRRQASSFSLANDADRGEPQPNGLTVKPSEWRGSGAAKGVVCDRPCADLAPGRPCVSLAWVVAVAFLNAEAPTVARTVSPYRARVGCERGGEDDATAVLLESTFRKIGWMWHSGGSGEKLIVPNDRRGITRLVRTISRFTPECVVLEASGGYERRLLERLAEEELPVALVNPRNIREFARASGRLAKTDAIRCRGARALR